MPFVVIFVHNTLNVLFGRNSWRGEWKTKRNWQLLVGCTVGSVRFTLPTEITTSNLKSDYQRFTGLV